MSQEKAKGTYSIQQIAQDFASLFTPKGLAAIQRLSTIKPEAELEVIKDSKTHLARIQLGFFAVIDSAISVSLSGSIYHTHDSGVSHDVTLCTNEKLANLLSK